MGQNVGGKHDGSYNINNNNSRLKIPDVQHVPLLCYRIKSYHAIK